MNLREYVVSELKTLKTMVGLLATGCGSLADYILITVCTTAGLTAGYFMWCV